VCEDFGWREWLWFPGLPQNEFAHWWVSEATTELRGEFFPAYGPLSPISRVALHDEEQLILHIDGIHNTYLGLHKKYNGTLPPKFAWSTAEPDDCGSGPAMETLQKWWAAITLTRTSSPDAYLWNFKDACVQIAHYRGSHPLPPDVLALIEFNDDYIYRGRNWDELPGLLPIPFFEPGTGFWIVDGEPYWGKWWYQSAARDHTVTERFMASEGRPISEGEFLFYVSFLVSHRIPGLPMYTSVDGFLPAKVPATYSYWHFDGRLTAISREGFVRCWPYRGMINADKVRAEGTQLSEAEFRRHFPRYAG
jgi:hypothetical protein